MTNGFDLDAVLGESTDKPLTYKGKTYTLPAELPADCLGPFLSDELGLIALITDWLNEDSATVDAGGKAKPQTVESLSDMVFDVLRKRPNLPSGLLNAARESFVLLIGADQYAEFVAQRPSLAAYFAIARGVVTEYGVGLADFFGSPESSDTAGDDSKPTSPTTTTDSTPEVSGDAPAKTDS